jgi:ribosomal protein L17
MRRLCIAVCCLYLASTALADDDSQFVLDSVETKFAADISKALVEVTRAETELAKARKNAASARLKAYKEKLVEITKTGDFDKAQKVKARIDALEKDAEPDLQPVKKTAKIPKDAVKFGSLRRPPPGTSLSRGVRRWADT